MRINLHLKKTFLSRYFLPSPGPPAFGSQCLSSVEPPGLRKSLLDFAKKIVALDVLRCILVTRSFLLLVMASNLLAMASTYIVASC